MSAPVFNKYGTALMVINCEELWKLREAMWEMSRRAHCPDLFDPSTRSRFMFEGARADHDAALDALDDLLEAQP